MNRWVVRPFVFGRDSSIDHSVRRIDLSDPELALLTSQYLLLLQQTDQRLDDQCRLLEFPLQFLNPLVGPRLAKTFPTLFEDLLGPLEILRSGGLRDTPKMDRLRLFREKEVE